MVNTIYTEPDPEPDLDPDIRNYSHSQQKQSSDNQVNRGLASSTPLADPLGSSPLSFVSEKPTDVNTSININQDADATINEKDHATPGTARTATSGFGTMETTLNPSPSRNGDQTSIYSRTSEDEDEEPKFPFISWKTSAIVGPPHVAFSAVTNQ